MSPEETRRLVVILSLVTLVAFSGFLILAPLFWLSMGSADAFSLVQIVFPVFAGYVGSAATFLGAPKVEDTPFADPTLAKTIVWGTFALFWFLGACLFVAYFVTNLAGGPPGMTVGQLATYIALFLALLNATVGALSSSIFRNSVTAAQVAVKNDATRLTEEKKGG